MVMVRLLSTLLKRSELGRYVVPIVPDEARTFGMDGLFKVAGIYSPEGQKYRPVDADSLLPYREAADGQILQEGICEVGAMASFMAAGSAYAVHGLPMIPFYIFYSMFVVSNAHSPSKNCIFRVAVKLQNTKFYNGEGKSKKEAEQNAALLCLNDNLI